ncbi:MAG: peroxide stress protein YaaA [Verrucomicrobiota bacterium]
MLAIISPAKTLDYESPPLTDTCTKPEFLNHSKELIKQLRTMSEDEIGALMSISPKLATLNAERYQSFKPPFTADNAKQALLAFKGDVYTGFELPEYEEADFAYAQDHLRILSGLYGLLRPLDLMQAYRLEMGTKLKNKRGKDLYAFWGDTITTALNDAIAESGSKTLVNLASNEYYHSVQPKDLDARIITPVFKDEKNGKLKIISFFAKKARGVMSDFLIRKRVEKPEGLKKFKGMGYAFSNELSEGDTWVFTRPEAA